MVEIVLRCEDWEAVNRVAHARHHQDGYRRPDGSKTRWETEYNSAAAELAVARWLGVEWSESAGNRLAPDVPPYEVRWVPEWHDRKRLMVKDVHIEVHGLDCPVVLVVGTWPTYLLRGWATNGQIRAWGQAYVYERRIWCLDHCFLSPMWAAPLQPGGRMNIIEPHQEPHANVLLYGPPKNGKTAGAASAPGRILYLNADLPNALLYANRARNQDGRITWAKFEGMETLKEVGHLVEQPDPGFDTLVLDPVGEAYRIMLEEQTNRAISNIDVRHYQFVSVQLERFCRAMCEADVNFIIVAHDRPVEDESNGTVERMPVTGTKNPDLGRKLMSMVDVIGYCGVVLEEGQSPKYMAQLASGGGRHGGDRFDTLGPFRELDLAEWFKDAGINTTTAQKGQKEKVAA